MESKYLAMTQHTTSSSRLSSLFNLHGGVLLLGVSGLFAKLIELPALDIIAHRSLFTAIALALFLGVTSQRFRLNSGKDYLTVTVLGILAGLHWVTYFLSIQLTTVAVGMVSLFTYPVMIVLLEPLFRKQLPHKKDIGLSLVVLFGISLLMPNLWQSGQEVNEHFYWGIASGLFSALCFALRNIGIQHFFKGYSGTQSMFYQFLIAALLFLPLVQTSVTNIGWHNVQLLIVFAIFFSAMAHVMFTKAIGTVGAKTSGLVACLQPFYGTVLSLLILAEVPTLTTIIGGLIVVFAAVYETAQSGKNKP